MKLRDIYDHPVVDGALIGAQRSIVERAEDAGEEPILWFKGNTNDEDRYGTIVEPSGAVTEPYMASGAGTFLFAHDYASLPIGKTLQLKQNKKTLDFKIRYAVEIHEQARIAYLLSANGYLPATSIGFIPLKWEEYESNTLGDMWAENRRFTSWELLELSAVPVPANRYALKKALDSRLVTENELRAVGLDKSIFRDAPYVIGRNIPLYKTPELGQLSAPQKQLQNDFKSLIDRVVADAVKRGAKVRAEVEQTDDTPPVVPPTVPSTPVADDDQGETDFDPATLTDENTPVDDPDEADRSLVEYMAAARDLIENYRMLTKAQRAERVRIVRAFEKRHPDIPTLLETIERAGAVLNKTNKQKLTDARALVQEVLDSAGDPDDNGDDDSEDDDRAFDVDSIVRDIVDGDDEGEPADAPDDSTQDDDEEGAGDDVNDDSDETSPTVKSAIELILS